MGHKHKMGLRTQNREGREGKKKERKNEEKEKKSLAGVKSRQDIKGGF